jgi:TonB-linked SusC/RagA family outer membrane protein
MIRRLQTNCLLHAKKSLWLVMVLCTSLVTYGQSKISGQVADQSGAGIPGASVLIEGTSQGTITDFDGNFSLSVPTSAEKLVISFVGYEPQTVSINGKTSFSITLSEDTKALEEVVVIGYGTQKKSDLTGAISGVDAQVLTERGVTNATQAMQGSIAGVQVTNNTGRVGDGFNITIRGKNTLQSGANAPLFVVDGVVTAGIDFLNPQDIAKIDVLKDASSAAIYGSRGSNGVVIIQTKNGANVPSGTTVSVESFYGIKKTARLPQMMSPEKWKYYHMSAYLATVNPDVVVSEEDYVNAVLSPASNTVLKTRFDNNDGFDWYDAVLQDGMQSNTHLTVNHRNGGSSYSLGIGFQNETGNIAKEGLDKYTMRLAMDQQLGDDFKAGATFSVSHSNIQRGSELAMREAFRLNPFLSPWAIDANGNELVGELFTNPGKLTYPDGSFAANKTSTYNPLLEIRNSSDETRQWNAVASTYLKYDPTDWLSLKSTFSTGLQSYSRGIYAGAQTNKGASNGNLPSSSVQQFENFNYTWDNQANIKKSFNKNEFNLLLLQSVYVDRTDTSSMASTNQPFDTEYYNVGSGLQSSYLVSNYFAKNQLLSYAVRLNYSFDDRYLITLTNRWDGSSLLAEGLKWNAFPSAAFAWRISNEAFMPKTDVLSDLKFRASYGTTGNNNVNPYSTVSTLDQQTYYNFGANVANGWIASNLANKRLTWEKTKETNLGLDFSLLDYRITGSVDWYTRTSDELLLEQTLPLETGFSSIRANAGSVKNSGVEIALTTTNVRTDLITWETVWTFTKNTNEIVSIYGQDKVDDVGNGWFIGEPIDAHYNYKFNGIWQADEAAEAAVYNQTEGQAKVVDVNNDQKIDASDDRVILGSSSPDWVGGLISRVTVGAFDLNVSVYAKQGVLAYSNFHANFEDMRDRGRQKLDVSDWYVPANNYGVEPQASNKYPQPRNGGTYWRNDGVGYYKDASFVKINNISVGYTLPASALNKINLSYLRLYVNVLNPFVFTDYTGYDPEWAEADFNVGRVSNTTTQFGMSLKF